MMKNFYFLIVILHITHAIFADSNKTVDPDQKAKADKCMAKQQSSIGFLENKGQMVDMNGRPVPFVLFRLETPDMDIYVTEKGLSYIFKEVRIIEKGEEKENDIAAGSGRPDSDEEREEIDMKWQRVDANLQGAVIDRGNIIPGKRSGGEHYNFFHPNCPDGIYDVKKYKDVTIKNIYPGIDWVLRSTEHGMKYDFIVNPGASVSQIQIQYDHIKDRDIKLLADGSVRIKVGMGTISEAAPVSYQEGHELKTKFVLNGRTISFSLPDHNSSKELDIDPQMYWNTYFGSGGTTGAFGVVVSKSGEVYIGGYAQNAASFPLLNPGGGVYFQGVFNTGAASGGWMQDGWFAKFDANYNFIWSTYYASNASESIMDMALNNAGDLFIVGTTGGSNLPIQVKAGAYNQSTNYGAAQMFLAQFNSAGIRQWATFYGDPGGSPSSASSIDIDPTNGNIVIGGSLGINSPLYNPGGGAYYQSTISGNAGAALAFIEFTAAGVLKWATYFGDVGGSGTPSVIADVRFTPSGNLLATGQYQSNTLPVTTWAYQPAFGGFQDVFAAEFSPSRNLTWCTYLGGSNYEYSYGICGDKLGNVFVFGNTMSLNYPVVNPGSGAYFDNGIGGSSDFFISKFSPAKTLMWSTFFGGSNGENQSRAMKSIHADNCNNIFIGGVTYSDDAPVMNPGCGAFFDNTLNPNTGSGLRYDLLFAKFRNNGNLLWSTYFGGGGQDWGSIAMDNKNRMFSSGETLNTPLTLVNPGGGAYFDNTHTGNHDAFVVRFDPVLPTFTQAQVNSTGCGCNGTATITMSCGNPNYSYIWSNGNKTLNTASSTNTVTGLCPGTYTVKGISMCDTVSTTYTISGGSGSFTLSTSQNNVNCNTPGSSSVTVAGGTGPYTYNWSPVNQSSQTATGLAIGTYTVIVTDNAGCTNSTSVTITKNLSGVTANGSIIKNVSCFGKNDGSATVNVAGGTGPFIYSWTPSGQVAQTAAGLVAGTYTVNVTDVNGCSATTTIAITQPVNITVGVNSSSNVSCGGGNNGSVFVNVAGGILPYTYLWSNGQTTTTASGLAMGNHTVTVTDISGCFTAAIVPMDATNKVDATAAKNSICIGDSVQLNSTISGPLCLCGARPAGCAGATSVLQSGNLTTTINQRTPFDGTLTGQIIQYNYSAADLIATGLSCGIITKIAFNVQTKASTQPFSGFTIKMLCDGTTSQLNDKRFTTVFNPKAITTAAGWNTFVFDTPYQWNGTSDLTVEFCWENTSTSAADIVYMNQSPVGGASGKRSYAAGTNCATTVVSESWGGFGITTQFTFCPSPIVYSWTPALTLSKPNIANPRSGASTTTIYTVSVSGVNGCVLTDTVKLNVNNCTSPLSVDVSGISVCPASCGNLTAIGNSGTSPYTYSWSTGSTTKTINVCPGATSTYTVKITDALGVTSTTTATATVYAPISVSATPANTTCSGSANGSVTANPSTGVAPYTYAWSAPATGQTSQIATGLSTGTYTVTVTDANGCRGTTSATVSSSIVVSAAFTPGGPICVGTTVNFTNTGTAGTHSWTIGAPANVSGTTVNFTYKFLSTGTYSVSHTVNTSGCTNNVVSNVQVINCTGPIVAATGSSVCPGSCGTVSSSGSGGTSPYTYSWSNGSTTQNINPCPVSTTTYTVTIRDAGGSTSTSTAIVTLNPPVSVIATATGITCNGATDGSAVANAGSGTPGYTYSWSNGMGSGFQVSGLSAGVYTVTVVDAKGCTASSTATIISPPALVGQFTKGTASCVGCGCKEWLLINATGGTSPYSYSWSDGYANRYKNQLCPGSYLVNIKDKNGCSINASLTTP